MTAKVINLRAARKSAARDAARRKGAENAEKFGLGKARKAAQQIESDRARRHLNGLRLDHEGTQDQADD